MRVEYMLKKWSLWMLFVLTVMSCSARKPKENVSAEERLSYAMKKFIDKDYFDARKEFTVIVLNFPGHQVVDEAQFYLAECHFYMKEYILAIAEYEKLVRMLPNSEFVDDSQYKIGFSNFKLSPKYALDQNYTLKAIEELQKLTEDYPNSEYKEKAIELLGECRDKLAMKEYKNGELYRKMGFYDAAAVYFESVLQTYYDTRFARDSQFWMAECLRKEGKYDEAIVAFNQFLEKYPDSNRKGQVVDLIRQAENSKKREGSEQNPSKTGSSS